MNEQVTTSRQPGSARRVARHRRLVRSPEGNARLTAGTAVLLFLLFAVEGFTVLSVGTLLTAHVFVGVLLLGPIMLKIGSTTWRFVRYYRADPAYREKGPPPILLRLLGPFVVVLSLAVVLSGIGLIVGAPSSWHDRLLFVHKATFVLWFGAMTVHILGHLLETARMAPRDWLRRSRRSVPAASARQLAIAGSLAGGLVLALWLTPYASSFGGGGH